MRRIVTTIALLTVVSASCSSGLSEAEAEYCRGPHWSGVDGLMESAAEMGVDLVPIFDTAHELTQEVLWELQAESEDGDAVLYEATDAAWNYLEQQPDYIRVCRAVHEDRPWSK